MSTDPSREGPSQAQQLERRGSDVFLYSKLWVDRPDALDLIAARRAQDDLEPWLAESLAHFVEQGYLVLPALPEQRALFEGVIAEADEAWATLPRDLAYAFDGPARRMTSADPERDRRPKYRIHDLHGRGRCARALYLDRRVFRVIEEIYREPAVAIQSLFFEYGSQQAMHRDPVVVPTAPASHLLAAWFALEDIHPDCGPLMVVPGSHRLPYYEFAPGQFMFDPLRMGADEAEAAMAWDREHCAAAGLEATPYLAKRGEVLLWHHSLLHGGSPPRNAALSRKSFVVHFSTARCYRQRAITLDEDGEFRVFATGEHIEENGCLGFANPVSA